MPKKMQNGGTFLGPFATQAGQATPRQAIPFGTTPRQSVPFDPRGSGPTINLPGQDPINVFPGFPSTAETEESRLRRQEQQQEQKFQKEFKRLQDEIDNQIANSDYNIDDAVTFGVSKGMSPQEVRNSTTEFQQSLAQANKGITLPDWFTGIFGDDRTGKKGILGEFAARTAGAKGIGFLGPTGKIISTLANKLDEFSISYSNLTNPTPTGAFPTDPGGQFRSTGPIQDMTQPLTPLQTQGSSGGGAPTVPSTLDARKAEIFNTISFVSRPEDATNAFSSAAHSEAGVSLADEVELIAKSGESIDRGKQLIETFVNNGLDKDDIDIAIDPQADTSGLAPSLGFDPGAALGFGPGRG